jgi:RNA polymerase sigma factor (sigma-70 family)
MLQFMIRLATVLLLLTLRPSLTEGHERSCHDNLKRVVTSPVDSNEALRLFMIYKTATAAVERQKARAALLEYLYSIAQFVGDRYAKRRGFKSSEDFVQDAEIGIIGALDAFDPLKGNIVAYFSRRAFGELVDRQRSGDWVPRSTRYLSRLREALSQSYIQQYGHLAIGAPSFEDFLSKEVSDPEILKRLLRQKATIPRVLTSATPDSSGSPIASQGPSPEIKTHREDMWLMLGRGLSEKDHAIFQMYFRERKSQLEISQILDLSESIISRRLKIIVGILKTKILENSELKKDIAELLAR